MTNRKQWAVNQKSPFDMAFNPGPMPGLKSDHDKMVAEEPQNPLKAELGRLLSAGGGSAEALEELLDMMATEEHVAEFRRRLRSSRVTRLAGALAGCPAIQEIPPAELSRILSVPLNELAALARVCRDMTYAPDEVLEALDLSKVSNVTEEGPEGDVMVAEMREIGTTTGRMSSAMSNLSVGPAGDPFNDLLGD